MTVGCTIQTHGPETSAALIHEDETVVLVICAAVFVVFQLEVAFLKLHLIRRERTIVGHFVDDGIDDTAFANEMPLAGELFSAEPHAKHHRRRLFVLHMPAPTPVITRRIAPGLRAPCNSRGTRRSMTYRSRCPLP